jgi:hypothetical protein
VSLATLACCSATPFFLPSTSFWMLAASFFSLFDLSVHRYIHIHMYTYHIHIYYIIYYTLYIHIYTYRACPITHSVVFDRRPISVHRCIIINKKTHTHTHTHTHTQHRACPISVHRCIKMNTNTNTHTHTHTHTRMYVCMYVCM